MKVDGTRRWPLLPFVLLAAWQARGYLLDDPVRFDTPSFDAPKQLGAWLLPDIAEPMRAWGVVFAVGALCLTAALLRGSYDLTVAALFVGGFIYALWAFIFAIGALSNEGASTNGVGQFGFDAAMHFLAILLLRERQLRYRVGRAAG